MSSHVKSHSTPRGKRGIAWDARRIIVLIGAIAAIVAASWLAPDLSRPPPGSHAAQPLALKPAPAGLATVEPTADLAAPRPPARASRRRRSGVPPDASSDVDAVGYEILSADELAGISQARD